MNCIFIGNGKMAIDCFKVIENRGWKILNIFSSAKEDATSSSFQKFLDGINRKYTVTEKLNSGIDFDTLKQNQIDLVFTINSYKILKDQWFKIPKIGIVNFHNSLLPNYKGVNIPYWVLQNNEKEHGVTWHFIDDKVDQGYLLKQESFEITNRDTNSSVTNKCIKKGIEIFPEVLEKVSGISDIKKLPVIGEGTCYTYSDKPLNQGEIDFSMSFEKINGLVRGLNFMPYSNSLEYAHIMDNDNKVVVNKVSKYLDNFDGPHGKYLGVDKKGRPLVSCSDAIIILEECMTEDFKLLKAIDIFEHTNNYNE